MFSVGGYQPDPDIDSVERGAARGKADWLFGEKVAPHLGDSLVVSDLTPYSSPVQNQVHTSSCVAQSWAKLFETLRLAAGMEHIDLSILSLYYQARRMMNPSRTNKDRGTHIWICGQALRTFGIARESVWPFDPAKVNTHPGWATMRNAAENKVAAVYKIDGFGDSRLENIVKALASGSPVVYGTDVDSQWDNYRAGDVIGPVKGEVRGGHATLLLGWNGKDFIGENSWGPNWGDRGLYKISPERLSGFSSNDFWTGTLQRFDLE
jgi:C1A family cysteine protease